MKRLISLLLLVVIAIVPLSGCADPGNSVSGDTQPSSTADTATTDQTEVTEVTEPEVTEPEVPDPTKETVYDPYPVLEIEDGRITVEGSKKMYRDDGITFSFPVGWIGFECRGEDGTSYSFRNPMSEKSGVFGFTITSTYYIHERTTAAEYLELYSHDPELTDVKIISLTKETLSGYDCTKVVASYMREGMEYITIDYDYVITGVRRYDFTVTYPASERATYEPVFDAIIDSLRLDVQNDWERKIGGTVSAGGEGLYVRNGPGTTYNICGFVSDGSRVEILERQTVGDVQWGRTRKGWICLRYVIVDSE